MNALGSGSHMLAPRLQNIATYMHPPKLCIATHIFCRTSCCNCNIESRPTSPPQKLHYGWAKSQWIHPFFPFLSAHRSCYDFTLYLLFKRPCSIDIYCRQEWVAPTKAQIQLWKIWHQCLRVWYSVFFLTEIWGEEENQTSLHCNIQWESSSL